MNTIEFVKRLNSTDYYVLDTVETPESGDVIHGEGDQNYIRYCYNIHKYTKLEVGGVFLYRQAKRSSKYRKFYFFGGGKISEIRQVNDNGDMQVFFEEGSCFRFLQPVFEDDPKLENIEWKTKVKKPGEWAHFWNQYGMNKISKDEFFGIIDGTECTVVSKNSDTTHIEGMFEEVAPVEKIAKNPEDFIGTYVADDGEVKKTTEPKSRKSVAKKIDYESLNKTKKNIGTFGEILIYNDEVRRVAEAGITKEVEHVALTQGDGLGYDVLSYDEKGNELYIEVKTTKANQVDGFYLTEKELKVAHEHADNFRLYRVYNLNMDAGTYSVQIFTGRDIESMFDVKPVSFVAVKKSN